MFLKVLINTTDQYNYEEILIISERVHLAAFRASRQFVLWELVRWQAPAP